MLSLEEILYSKELGPLFIEYAKKTLAHEGVEFWLEIEVYKRVTDSMECLLLAKRIYSKYLSSVSSSEINMEGTLKAQIEAKIIGGLWDTHLFDQAQRNIYETLKLHCVRNFESSRRKSTQLKGHKPISQKNNKEIGGVYQLMKKYRKTIKQEKRQKRGFLTRSLVLRLRSSSLNNKVKTLLDSGYKEFSDKETIDQDDLLSPALRTHSAPGGLLFSEKSQEITAPMFKRSCSAPIVIEAL